MSSAVEERREDVMTACTIHGLKHVAVKYDAWELRKKAKNGEWETQSHEGGWYIGRVVRMKQGTTTAIVEYKYKGSYSTEEEALTRGNYILMTDDPNEVKCGTWTALRVAKHFPGRQSLSKRQKKGVSRGPALQSEQAGSTNNTTRTSSRISRPSKRMDPEVYTT